MNDRFCHRCQAELPTHEEGTLIFCTHCGAPQVHLSEELKDQMELQTAAAADAANVPASPRDPRSVVWRDALHCVGLATVVAAGLGIASVVFPPVLLLAWLWAVISPVVVMGVFQARSPLTRITTGFGARLGLVTGLAIALTLGIINTVELLVARRMHALGDFDSMMQTRIDQFRMQAEAQPGAPAVPLAHALALPDFRAGLLLTGFAACVVMLVAITTAGGAFAGFVRARNRA